MASRKLKRIILAALLLAALALATTPAPSACAGDMVQAYDTSGDGALSKSEAKVALYQLEAGTLGQDDFILVVWCHLSNGMSTGMITYAAPMIADALHTAAIG